MTINMDILSAHGACSMLGCDKNRTVIVVTSYYMKHGIGFTSITL